MKNVVVSRSVNEPAEGATMGENLLSKNRKLIDFLAMDEWQIDWSLMITFTAFIRRWIKSVAKRKFYVVRDVRVLRGASGDQITSLRLEEIKRNIPKWGSVHLKLKFIFFDSYYLKIYFRERPFNKSWWKWLIFMISE